MHCVGVTSVAPRYIETALTAKLIQAGKVNISRVCSRTLLARMGLPKGLPNPCCGWPPTQPVFVGGVTLPVDVGWGAFAVAPYVQSG